MQNFLKVDDGRAQRLLRSSALSSGVVPLCGAQEMSEQGASAAHEGELRLAYAARHTSLATQYFCSLAPQFLENSNGDCASSITVWLWRNAELLKS
jgi:hypothetical protein